mgnify:CR=1 FL=1
MFETNVKWLKEISDQDILEVGYKAHVLSELAKSNISIPRGFVINNKNFFSFLQKGNLKEKITEILKTIDYTTKTDIEEKSKKIKELFLKTKLDEDFISDVLKMYIKVGESKVGFINSKVDEFVSIRASLSSEEYPLKELDFIETQIGFLNIKGRDNVINCVKECWSELYSPEILEYKFKKGFEEEKIHLSIIVQKMIPGKKSGILLTSKENNKDTLIIEAIYGFGGKSIINEITPDHYEINKKTGETIRKTKSKQEWMLKRILGKTTKAEIEEKDLEKYKLEQREINELLDVSKKLELIYGTALELNWVIDSNEELFIISANPINPDLKKIKKKKKIDITTYQEKMDTFKKKMILEGIGVSSGISIGNVKIVKSNKDLKEIDENSILVTKMTTLEMTPYLRKSKGIITDAGGTICHAALISKKYDIPCVVHTQYSTAQLKDGEAVLVNGFNGKIYSVVGYVTPPKKIVTETKRENEVLIDVEKKEPEYPKTITKTIIKLENFEELRKINLSDIDGVILTIDSLFTSYQKGTMLENLKLLVPNIKSKLLSIINVLKEKEIYYRINTHTRNLMTENVSSYEIEAILEIGSKINILLENIKSADEITPIKEITDSKIGVIVDSLKENLIIEYLSRGSSFIVFSLEEIDYIKLKEIIKICKDNKILRLSDITEKNNINDVKQLIEININGIMINKNQIEFKDTIYRKEKELLKNLLSI